MINKITVITETTCCNDCVFNQKYEDERMGPGWSVDVCLPGKHVFLMKDDWSQIPDWCPMTPKFKDEDLNNVKKEEIDSRS